MSTINAKPTPSRQGALAAFTGHLHRLGCGPRSYVSGMNRTTNNRKEINMIDKQPFEDLEALRKMKGLAVAWLREGDWPAWLAMDPDFQPDFDHWLRRIEAAYAHYQAAGINVVKVEIDPDEFLEWSRANGAGVNSTARATFAAFKMLSIDDRQVLH